MSEAARLHRAFDDFVAGLESAERSVRASPTFAGDGEPSRAYLHLLRSLMKSIERELTHDPVRPRFRVLDDRTRTGGDNPDQQYWFAHIAPGGRYRVDGRLGSAQRLEMQLYSREPYGAEDVGVAYLTHEQIGFDADGRFSVDVGPGLDVDSTDATILQVREIYDSWSDTQPTELVIELVEAPGPPTPRSGDDLVAMFERAAHDLQRSAEAWPSLISDRVLSFLEPNSVSPLRNPGGSAGVEGRWMTIGPYRLDHASAAVVISLSDEGADYVGIQLADLWMASLEYADATSSRTGAQSHRAPDGRLYHVISLEDPGYRNWLDPVGVAAGIVHIRVDGLAGAAEEQHEPIVIETTLADLADVIPGFAEAVITADERAVELAERRRHVQQRYGR